MRLKWISFLLIFSLLLQAEDSLLQNMGLDSDVVKQETKYSCHALSPAAPPAQHSGAEGLPPLPLPVVPLRRTEKKNPPRPPVLVAKLATGNRNDWATNPSDIKNLLRWMAENLNVHFSSIIMPVNRIPSDLKELKKIPVIYRTGHDSFQFSPQERKKLHDYVLQGGTLLFDACCGRAAFVKSAIQEIRAIMPERSPYFLDTHHPLFHSFFDIKEINFRPYALKAGAKNNSPDIIGVDIGCRTAIFFFRWDMSCGWDNLPDSDTHHCLGYTIPCAKEIGANLMAYITAEHSAAIPLSQSLKFVDETQSKAGKFEIARIKYNGIWKTREAGLSMLLNTFHQQTKTPIRFAEEEVTLDSKRLFDLPFVYMTGHQNFILTENERAGLRSYLMRGGILLAEACCGRAGFQESFLYEMTKVMPGFSLERLPPNHPIFLYPNTISAVHPRPALAKKLKTKNAVIPPELYALKYKGHIAVIYSPRGLSCGWELAECPYCEGLQSKDAITLGVNILSYCIMQ